MKLISLNTWAGHEYEALMKFIGSHKADTDIFCLQEMCTSPDGPKVSRGTRTRLLNDVEQLLDGFTHRFSYADGGFDEVGEVEFEIRWGQSTFVREGNEILESGEVVIHPGDLKHRQEFDYRHVMQYVRIDVGGKPLTICNVHATPFPGSKLDTPKRIAQSERILEFLSGIGEPLIVAGDFNLMPDTRSITMIENHGLENLIKTYDIQTTRGSLNPYLGTPQQQDFADYTLVSPGVIVEQFDVPDARISDHCPMLLNFSLKE